MDSAYLQRIRFQLQKRVRRLNSCSYLVFHSSLVQFWNYLQSQSLTSGILGKLEAQAKTYTDEIAAITTKHEIEEFNTEAEQFAFAYRVIQHCAVQPLSRLLGPEVTIAHAISGEYKHDEALNQFREMFLEPLYEYIDDALDQQGAVLSLLLKYKRKVEWFEREALAQIASGDERKLAKHLYAYLFDQGLDFHIEPQSASGEADLVAPSWFWMQRYLMVPGGVSSTWQTVFTRYTPMPATSTKTSAIWWCTKPARRPLISHSHLWVSMPRT